MSLIWIHIKNLWLIVKLKILCFYQLHDSIELLSDLGLEIFKIPSGEITNLPYLRHIGKLNKKVILSTGMADIGEIEDALDVLINAGTKKENITVLHANTMYPTPMEDVNLKAMVTIGNTFDIAFGYSDHTLGIEVDIAAVALIVLWKVRTIRQV